MTEWEKQPGDDFEAKTGKFCEKWSHFKSIRAISNRLSALRAEKIDVGREQDVDEGL